MRLTDKDTSGAWVIFRMRLATARSMIRCDRGLSVELEQSPFLSNVPDAEVHPALQMMQNSEAK